MKRLASIFVFLLSFNVEAMEPQRSAGSSALPAEIAAVKITEKLGEKVDIHGLRFRDEQGQAVTLSQYFAAGKPVILMLVYYKCPGICNYLLNGFTNSIRSLDWSIGNQFQVVTLSINPDEGPELASGKKETYIRKYSRLDTEKGWHWLTGSEDQIGKLANQIGFGYQLDPKTNEYAHGSALFILAPDGMISRVLYGIDFPSKDLKLSLLEASDGKVGSIFERVWMLCYQYDPMTRGYGLQALRVVQAGGILTIILLAAFLFWFWRRERKEKLWAD